MSNPAFWGAYEIVPIIIVAYIFQAWTKFCDLGILLKKKTMQIAHAEMIAVLVITIAYFTLIPAYGIYGAAWAAVIGFFTRFYWTLRKGNQHYDMELPWIKVSQIATLAMIIFALSLVVPDDLILSISLRVALIASFITIFFALPILSCDEKKEIKQLILTIKKHPKLLSASKNKR